MKNYDPKQWNNVPPATVDAGDLAAAAADFPPVKCVCETCNGEGRVYATQESQPQCHTCEGAGYFLREMDSREEHYYILYLLKTRYQLR